MIYCKNIISEQIEFLLKFRAENEKKVIILIPISKIEVQMNKKFTQFFWHFCIKQYNKFI